MDGIRLGLVGLGKIARDQHLPAIAATPGIALAGIASRHAGLPDLPSFATLEELLQPLSSIKDERLRVLLAVRLPDQNLQRAQLLHVFNVMLAAEGRVEEVSELSLKTLTEIQLKTISSTVDSAQQMCSEITYHISTVKDRSIRNMLLRYSTTLPFLMRSLELLTPNFRLREFTEFSESIAGTRNVEALLRTAQKLVSNGNSDQVIREDPEVREALAKVFPSTERGLEELSEIFMNMNIEN